MCATRSRSAPSTARRCSPACRSPRRWASIPVAPPLITAFSLDLNGNAITVSTALWARMVEADPTSTATRPVTAAALRRVIDADRRHDRPPLRFAMVYPFATHNYELRYWLAAAGIDPDDDVQLTVVPPPRMVEALERRRHRRLLRRRAVELGGGAARPRTHRRHQVRDLEQQPREGPCREPQPSRSASRRCTRRCCGR